MGCVGQVSPLPAVGSSSVGFASSSNSQHWHSYFLIVPITTNPHTNSHILPTRPHPGGEKNNPAFKINSNQVLSSM